MIGHGVAMPAFFSGHPFLRHSAPARLTAGKLVATDAHTRNLKFQI